MRIEKIELNKIKVTLCMEDLAIFNLNVKKLKPHSPELSVFLCELMKKVQSETNFDPYDGQVVVEATPNGDELVLIVTKLEAEVGRDKYHLKKIKHVKAVKKEKKEEKYICRFDKFEDILEFFRHSEGLSFNRSSLYKLHDVYYLIYVSQHIDIRIAEFSDSGKAGNMREAYLTEHASLVAEGDGLAGIADFAKKNEDRNLFDS